MSAMRFVSIDDIPWSWLSVRDSRRCIDCKDLTGQGPWLYPDLPTIPGAGDTECGGNCRCTLGPALTFGLMGRVSGESVLTIARDTGNLYEDFDGAKFAKISQLVKKFEDITSEYYGSNGDWNLPDTFYTDYMTFAEREKYLDGLIYRVRTNTLTDEDITMLEIRNQRLFAGNKAPSRVK